MNSEFHEWAKFTIQLQLFVLCALQALRSKGVVVRRHGLDVEWRDRRHWKPLQIDTATIESII